MVAANTKKEAEQKVREMDWASLMLCLATEINIVNGYNIKLEKEDSKNDDINM